MRVTEFGMMQRATEALQKAQGATADAADALDSGIRVSRASQDPVAWSDAARAMLRESVAVGHQGAIDRADARVGAVDQALASVFGVLSQARELAVQMGNDTYTAVDRAAAATQVGTLSAGAIAAANGKDIDGEYVLAGSKGTAAPFDAVGVYSGDAQARTIEIGEQSSLTLSVTGTELTAAAGVDVFQTLSTLKAALASNNAGAIRGSLTALGTAIDQLASARSRVGGQMSALQGAASARADLSLNLARIKDTAIAADPVGAASTLQRNQTAFSAAQAVATSLIAIFRKS